MTGWVQQLRGAVDRGDGAAVVELLAAEDRLPLWQLIGDGMATALAQRVDGAATLAADCGSALRARAGSAMSSSLSGSTGSLGPGRCHCCVRSRWISRC
ncbi:hypothetical protein [Pseudonocardia oroxyli]|uniref:Uncharacterized protein n=1 Tax=Pseudonocardia oroxyli TaxID=366584 RepID=A0A1G7SVB6_PSEOR|nr:hypothetical protein [Pseudonocardia oroxyli]SDG27046.1 hypothetical protein SAMN05216377_110112 [Pseudonocardia oroxyli]